MLFLKVCPKCHGDMYLDRDQYGAFIECLQCGLLRDIDESQENWQGALQLKDSQISALRNPGIKMPA